MCAVCERCLQYERTVKEASCAEQVNAIEVRKKRGSQFQNEHGMMTAGATSVASSTVAFSILAPPIAFKSRWRDVATSSAAKLYFVMSSCRRKLECRIESYKSSDELADFKWYLSPKEFEKLLLTCGVDWMERDQMESTYTQVRMD